MGLFRLFGAYVSGLLLLLLAAATLLSGCAANPATGRSQFNLVSEREEYELGRRESSAVLKEFGGLYKEKRSLNKYLDARLKELVSVSERANKPFKMWLLDSDVYNAMALPGYIMISRGILPYIHNEAQLMEVLGHEVGHVTARHSAQAISTKTVAGIGMVAAQVLLGQEGYSQAAIDAANQAASAASSLFFASYGRGHEYQADELGLRYMSRLGYDPMQAALSFENMVGFSKRHDRLSKELRELFDLPEPPFYHKALQSHPDSIKRVRELAEKVEKDGETGGKINRDRYLDMVDGIAFGAKVEDHGLQSRWGYAHPRYRFGFTPPEGFHYTNAGDQKILPLMVAPQIPASLDVRFKAVKKDEDAEESLIYTFPGVGNIEELEIGGQRVYTGTYGEDKWKNFSKTTWRYRVAGFSGRVVPQEDGEEPRGKAGFVAIKFAAPAEKFAKADPLFMQTIKSLTFLSKEEAEKIQPLRLKAYTVEKYDSFASVAANLPFTRDRMEWLSLLNGLPENSKLQPGMRLKIVQDVYHEPSCGCKGEQ